MAERTRRHPRRPVAFWAVFGAVALLGLGGAGLVWLTAERAPYPAAHTG